MLILTALKSVEFFKGFGIENTTRVLSKFGAAGVVMQSLENAKCYFRLSLIFRAKWCLFSSACERVYCPAIIWFRAPGRPSTRRIPCTIPIQNSSRSPQILCQKLQRHHKPADNKIWVVRPGEISILQNVWHGIHWTGETLYILQFQINWSQIFKGLSRKWFVDF